MLLHIPFDKSLININIIKSQIYSDYPLVVHSTFFPLRQGLAEVSQDEPQTFIK